MANQLLLTEPLELEWEARGGGGVRKTLFLVVVNELESGGMVGCLWNHGQWLGSAELVVDPEWTVLLAVSSLCLSALSPLNS